MEAIHQILEVLRDIQSNQRGEYGDDCLVSLVLYQDGSGSIMVENTPYKSRKELASFKYIARVHRKENQCYIDTILEGLNES